MVVKPFAAWEPDRYELSAEVAGEASGVMPITDGYGPWPGFEVYSDALASPCRGGIMVRTSAGTYSVFAGTATKLYKFDGGTGWTDVTRLAGGDYNVATDTRWSFAQFGSRLLATQENDVPQWIDIDSGTNFAALGGSPPFAKSVHVVGDHVFLVGLLDDPHNVIWSGRNNSDYWTSGKQDSDFQIFPSGGHVEGLASLVGGAVGGLVLQDNAINTFQSVTDRRIYVFAQVEESSGLRAHDSLVVHGPAAYYLSEDGFMATSLSGSRPIGAERIDNWFQTNCYNERISYVQGCADPLKRRVFWLFPTESSTSDTLDHVLCYDIVIDRWSHTQLAAQFIMPAAFPGISPDGMTALGYTDLDVLPFSLDAKIWQGGAPMLAGFNGTNRLCFLQGGNLAATLETAEWEIEPGRRHFVTGCRPYSDSASGTVQISARENQKDTTARTYSAATTINDQGFAPARVSTRYSRARLAIAAGETWSKAVAMDIMARPDGGR